MSSESIQRCLEALERLVNGSPVNVNRNYEDITYSLISREAGLDKGFVKPKRASHQPIVDALNTYNLTKKINDKQLVKSKLETVNEDLLHKLEAANRKIKELEKLLQIMMSDNLKLVEYSRTLEQENLTLRNGKTGRYQVERQH